MSQNTRLYVIGDVHGRLDLLNRTIDLIRADYAARSAPALTVTLGDYIDRGPDSRGVIERLAGNPFGMPYVALKGNHEAILETFLFDPSVGLQWSSLGGLETLASFGVPVTEIMLGGNLEETSKALKEALTPKHRDFLSSLRVSFSVDHYFFCHAGVRPSVPLDRQRDEDLLWIRDEFLHSSADFGKIVVHGHTPVRDPEVLPNRINIDTGAFATGRLTCIVLEGVGYRILT